MFNGKTITVSGIAALAKSSSSSSSEEEEDTKSGNRRRSPLAVFEDLTQFLQPIQSQYLSTRAEGKGALEKEEEEVHLSRGKKQEEKGGFIACSSGKSEGGGSFHVWLCTQAIIYHCAYTV